MRRRWILVLLAPLLPLVLLAGGQAALPDDGPTPQAEAPAVVDDRPNILVVNMDDMRFDELRWTPHVQRLLVEQGASFANSFAPNPLCCPSRTTFLLGQYSHQHGVLSHQPPYGFGSLDDTHTMAERMQDAGYLTGFTGKYLNGYGLQPSKVTGGSSLTYVPPGWDDWRAGVQTEFTPTSPFVGGTYSYFSFTENVDGTLTSHRGEYSSTTIANDTAELVRAYHEREAPWFIWMNPVAPHTGNPREPDDPAPFRLKDGRVIPFPTPARPEWVKGVYDARLRHAPGVRASGLPAEKDVSDKPPLSRRLPELAPKEEANVLEVSRQRAEALRAWDRQFARLVSQLQDAEEWANTIVVFTSDNGFLLGEHRLRMGKIWSYEESIRVPLVVAGPGVRRGVRLAPATTQDLTATVLDLAGAEPLPDMDGVSLAPVLRGADQAWDRAIVTEGYHPAVKNLHRLPAGLRVSGIRTGRWKLVHWANGALELYDLRTDPLELTNLAGDPAYAFRVRGLDRLWKQYAACAGEACRVPLPPNWRVGLDELRELDRVARARRLGYYGAPEQSPVQLAR